jgi:hypothetical protein
MRLLIRIALIITIAGLMPPALKPQPQEERAAFLKLCSMSIRLDNKLQPVEIQPDSFLAFHSGKKVYLAILCQPNPMRTFRPPAERLESSAVATLTLAVETNGHVEMVDFHSLLYRRKNHPLRRMKSMNLFFASRDQNYYITAYPHPDSVRKMKAEEIAKMDAELDAVIKLAAGNLMLHDGAKPAITEKQYQTRLLAAGAAILIATAALAGTFLYRRRKRKKNALPHRS